MSEPVPQPIECPACRASAPFYCAKTAYGQPWNIHRCTTCGHGFVGNRPTPETLNRIYSETDTHLPMDEPTSHEADALRHAGNPLIDAVARLSDERGDSLDVGSGSGIFSYHLRQKGYRPVMIDLDPRAEKAAASIPGGVFRRSTFEDFTHDRPFAAIVMSQVLEHSLSPTDWLRKARELLTPRGVLAVALPNFGGVYRVLGERDPFIIPPIHLNYFTRDSLNRMFNAAGLRAVKFGSSSQVNTRHPTRRFSAKRRIGGAVWNLASVLLDPTAKGIILHGFAVPAGPA
jgi:2-polyprenyl-3-methyl-5-hydroxy-6-metoxy-1,4-benzoquinol methylase